MWEDAIQAVTKVDRVGLGQPGGGVGPGPGRPSGRRGLGGGAGDIAGPLWVALAVLGDAFAWRYAYFKPKGSAEFRLPKLPKHRGNRYVGFPSLFYFSVGLHPISLPKKQV